MKLGIVIYSDDSETVWNAFRLGVFALKQKDNVTVFLLARGVDFKNLDSEKFKIIEMFDDFVAQGGKALACGSCLKIRNTEGGGVCEISTMQDLYQLVRDSDRIVTF